MSEYEATTEEITVLDGVEVDITVRAATGAERKADKALMDLKGRLGVLAAAYATETPPGELDDIPDEYQPPMAVAWDRVFADAEGDE